MENRHRFNPALIIRLLILTVLITCLLICTTLFWPRFFYQKGIKQLELKKYDKASLYLDRAEKQVPKFLDRSLAQADLFKIYTHLGQTLYHSAIQDWKQNSPSAKTYKLLQKGKAYLTLANTIAPLHYFNAYWLTQTEQALEKLYAWRFPKRPNPYNAYTWYKKALPMRPAGSTIRYAYVRYLNTTQRLADLPGAVQSLMDIDPPAYFSLKKEPFYSDTLMPHVEKGLTTAFQNNVLSRNAAEALSELYVNSGDTDKGISYFVTYLSQEPDKNSSYDYLRLGSLYLSQGAIENSHNAFKQSFEKSSNPQKALKQIYQVFKKQGSYTSFISFLSQTNETEVPQFDREMAAAQYYLDLEDLDKAKEILTRLSKKASGSPRVFYFLAVIAQKQKNWDQMELGIQKAVHLVPSNANYNYLFAQALAQQKKYSRAEAAITSAIQNASKENPWYYHYRASMRWFQKKYPQAVTDWEKAFSLKPDRADFAYRLALGYQNLAQFEKAKIFIKKALALAPDNMTYRDFLKKLDPS